MGPKDNMSVRSSHHHGRDKPQKRWTLARHEKICSVLFTLLSNSHFLNCSVIRVPFDLSVHWVDMQGRSFHLLDSLLIKLGILILI